MATDDDHKLSEHSVAEYTAVLWFFVACTILNLIRVYANRSMFMWHTYILVFIAYFCAFGLILLIPIDAALTILGRTDAGENNYNQYSKKIKNMYVSLYWPMFIMGAVLLVWWEHFNQDGHFTVLTRMLYAAKRQLKIWSMMSVGGIIFFSILLGTGVVNSSVDALQVTCIAINNTLGMTVIVVLLGYGLVQFPRQLWSEADLDKHLLKTQQRAAAAFKKFSEASLQVSLTVANVLRTNQEVQKLTDPDLRAAIVEVMVDCPKEFHSGTVGKVQVDGKGQITVNVLADLRRLLNIEKANYRMEQARVERIKRMAYYLEDVIASRSREDGVQRVRWSFGLPESTHYEWLWHVRYKPQAQRVLALACGALSFLVLLGVIGMMAGHSSDLSVFSLVVHKHRSSASGITIFILLTLGYLAYVVAWGMFQLRVGNMMQIVPDQQTTPKSMSCNSRQCCRLSPPIAFFYLGLIYENGLERGSWMDDQDGDRVSTAFSKFYGSMKVVPFFGDNFNTFFPVVILVIAGITLLNVLNKLFVFLKMPQFQFGDVEVTDDQLREGRRQLARQRKQMERTVARGQTRQYIEKARKYHVFNTIHNQLLKLTGHGSPTADEQAAESRVATEEGFVAAAPPEKAGWLEKKGGKKMGVSSGWQPRYFVVKLPGILYYYKTDNTEAEPQGSIDLRLILFLRHPAKKGSVDPTRLELELPDHNVLVRGKSSEEMQDWYQSILAWKDYILDQGVYFPSSGIVDKDGTPGETVDDDDNDNHDDEIKVDDLELGTKPRSPSKSTDPRPPSRDLPSTTLSVAAAAAAVSPATGDKERGSLEFGSKPSMLEGLLEKKSPNNKFHPWQSRYFRMNEETCCLEYFKSQADISIPSGSLDLRLVADITEYEKRGNSDGRRFNVDMGDKTYKLRASDARTAQHWIQQLNLWREYALLSYALHGND